MWRVIRNFKTCLFLLLISRGYKKIDFCCSINIVKAITSTLHLKKVSINFKKPNCSVLNLHNGSIFQNTVSESFSTTTTTKTVKKKKSVENGDVASTKTKKTKKTKKSEEKENHISVVSNRVYCRGVEPWLLLFFVILSVYNLSQTLQFNIFLF